MRAIGIITVGVLGIVAMFGLSWAVMGNNFFLYKYFAPKTEQVRHDVFKESQAYVDGKITHLTKLQLDYAGADSDTQRCTMRNMALREVATVDTSRLPADLVSWTNELKEDTSC